jgi:sporulation protein YlmC with PRC-barrel domain
LSLVKQLHLNWEKGCSMQTSNGWLATSLINRRVRNSAGENLGKIEDLIVDPQTGRIEYAIVSFGGVLSAGSKLYAIPWPALGTSASGDDVLFNADLEMLDRAPAFDRDNWPNMTDPGWRRRVDDYYRVTPVQRSRAVHVGRRATPGSSVSALGAILLVCVLVGAGWFAYMVSTRGWDQAKHDIRTSLQGAAFAAKEGTHEAALTTRVKTALSLSKRIPSDKINVDSNGDVVTLRGEVPSEQIRGLAESIARDVPGVAEVQNHLFAISVSR